MPQPLMSGPTQMIADVAEPRAVCLKTARGFITLRHGEPRPRGLLSWDQLFFQMIPNSMPTPAAISSAFIGFSCT